MPYKIIPIKPATGKCARFYRVVNTETGEVKAKKTTRRKAEAQVRLLYGLEYRDLIPRGR